MIMIQISSGNGPFEASLATKIVYRYILDNYQISPDNVSIFTNDKSIDIPRSIVIETDSSITEIHKVIGTWKVVFKSPYRNTDRKNWFVGVSYIESMDIDDYDSKDFKFSTFRSSGPGGQYVNKTETGIRVTYVPENISAESTIYRSQFLNRKEAIKKLQEKLNKKKADELATLENNFWKNHAKVERGNEIMTLKIDNRDLQKYIEMII